MSTFKALETSELENGTFESKTIIRSVDTLPIGDVLIRVHYSSLNYKDALSASGHRGVTQHYPHTPGVDAVGIIEKLYIEPNDTGLREGQKVIVTGYDLGMNTSGGLSEYIRVPASWVSALPDDLSMRDCMIYGTAGLTAALCVEKLLHMGLPQTDKNILVTGATGGVGSIAVGLLSELGYTVTASTGKPSGKTLLEKLGAKEIIDRSELSEQTPRPLLMERWCSAVDTVGGHTLANSLKYICYGGSIACCGLVQSADLPSSVLPFILRNINLVGIDSVLLPVQKKTDIWQKLATSWKINLPEQLITEITLHDAPQYFDRLLQGENIGRIVVNLNT